MLWWLDQSVMLFTDDLTSTYVTFNFSLDFFFLRNSLTSCEYYYPKTVVFLILNSHMFILHRNIYNLIFVCILIVLDTCRMDEPEEMNQNLGENQGVTKIKLSECIFRWSIENFRFSNKNAGECIRSPFFSSKDEQISWHLDWYPKAKTEDSKGYISIGFFFNSSTVEEFEAEYRISIINDKNVETHKLMYRDKFYSGKGRALNYFIKRDQLLDERMGLLPNGTLTLFCKIKAGISCENLMVKTQSID